MKNLIPLVAYIVTDDNATTIPALSVKELYNALAAYAKETEEQHVEWMAALPKEEDVAAAAEALKGTAGTMVTDEQRIGDWDEYFHIEMMPQWWTDRLIAPFVGQIRKLAGEFNSMIGHPENPFAENIIDELVVNAFKLINEPRPELTDWDEEQ